MILPAHVFVTSLHHDGIGLVSFVRKILMRFTLVMFKPNLLWLVYSKYDIICTVSNPK